MVVVVAVAVVVVVEEEVVVVVVAAAVVVDDVAAAAVAVIVVTVAVVEVVAEKYYLGMKPACKPQETYWTLPTCTPVEVGLIRSVQMLLIPRRVSRRFRGLGFSCWGLSSSGLVHFSDNSRITYSSSPRIL